MPEVMTVRGPVDASDIGSVMAHEHIFLDASRFYDPSGLPDPALGEGPFSADLAGRARWSGHSYRANMVFSPDDDFDLMCTEVRAYVDAAGPGACLVDLTTGGLSPDHAAVARVAEITGAHIVFGAGFYVHAMHPAWVEDATVEKLAAHLATEVAHGFGDSGVRPGIFGEIGTSVQLEPCEERVLRAAAQVAADTGFAINVHCEPPEVEVVHQILDVLESEGHDLTRTYLSHLDEKASLDYHFSVADRGPVIGFDSFGQEGWFSPTWRALTDLEKAQTAVALLEKGYGDQVVLAQDVCKKQHLTRFGGFGYDHVVARVVPRMQETMGVSDAQVEAMLHSTPLRLLVPVV